MSVFTSAVLQGLNAVNEIDLASNHSNFPGPVSSRNVSIVVGATEQVMQRTLFRLAKAGIIGVKRGPGGGFFTTQEQLRTKRVLDVLEALGQPCVAPEGSRASDRLQQRFYDSCDLTLEEFFG